MPDRVVSYSFRGNFAQLTAGLSAAGRGVQDFGGKLTALDRDGEKMRRGLDTLGTSAGRIGLVAAAGLGAVVAVAANFDAAMSKVQAATHETTENMNLLRQAAIEAGQATVYSASEAAGAIESLAKAGVSTKDILAGGLDGALNLAAAGGLEVAEAADIAATALTQFKLEGQDVGHVADLLAAGAGKAQGDVTDLGFALKQSGLVASQMGLSIEETTGTLAAFASAGLLGSDAGTSLRTMLLRLANPTGESAALLEKLGINAYDAAGQFVGMESIAGQLTKAFEGKTQAERDSALATIFGSDAIRAASVLYEQGAQGIQDWTNKTNDAGYAAETAATRLDNLKGDLEQLRGALETALIGAGDGSQGPLRGLVQGATDAVNAFNDLPGPIKNVATGLLAITAVTGGGLWFGAKVVGGIVSARTALDDLGVSAPRTARALRGLTGIGVATAAVLAFNDALAELVRSTDNAPANVEGLTKNLLALDTQAGLEAAVKDIGALKGAVQSLADPGLAQDVGSLLDKIPFGIGSNFADYAPVLSGPRQEARDYATAIQGVDAALAGIVTSGSAEQADAVFTRLAELYKLSAGEQEDLLGLMPAYQEALDAQSNSATLAAGASTTLADGTTAVGSSAEASAQQIDDLVKSMKEQREAALGAFDAETQYRQALKAAREQGAKNNAGIKGDSEAALANREAISGLAAAWNGQSEAVKNNRARYREARKAFIETAEAMGVPIEQARRLARRLLEIPESKVINFQTNAEQTNSKIRSIQTLIDRLRGKTLNIDIVRRTQGLEKRKDVEDTRFEADGGPIYGPGTKTSDSIPAMLSNGEYVIRAAAVDRYGVGFFNAANQMRLAAGGSPGGLRDYIRSDLDMKYPSTLKQWNQALAASTKLLDKEKTERQDLIDQYGGVKSAIASNYRSELFGGSSTRSPWLSDAERMSGSVAGFQGGVAGDIANLNALKAAIATLNSKGFDGAALAEVLSKGSLSDVQAFATQSKSELAGLEAQYNQREKLLMSVGSAGGQAAFGPGIAAQTAQVAATRDFTRAIDRIDGRLDNVVKALKGVAPKRPRKGNS